MRFQHARRDGPRAGGPSDEEPGTHPPDVVERGARRPWVLHGAAGEALRGAAEGVALATPALATSGARRRATSAEPMGEWRAGGRGLFGAVEEGGAQGAVLQDAVPLLHPGGRVPCHDPQGQRQEAPLLLGGMGLSGTPPGEAPLPLHRAGSKKQL